MDVRHRIVGRPTTFAVFPPVKYSLPAGKREPVREPQRKPNSMRNRKSPFCDGKIHYRDLLKSAGRDPP